jgi:hypothetical protein
LSINLVTGTFSSAHRFSLFKKLEEASFPRKLGNRESSHSVAARANRARNSASIALKTKTAARSFGTLAKTNVLRSAGILAFLYEKSR